MKISNIHYNKFKSPKPVAKPIAFHSSKHLYNKVPCMVNMLCTKNLHSK